MSTQQRPTLVARNLHVVYRTPVDETMSLRRRLSLHPTQRFQEVHALRGVDLTLFEGESVGIVGSNGSGKTTMVTALSGLLKLTQGEILAVARPALLGVGAALNKRLSGRRNVMLGLLALGLTKKEIDDRMASIIRFSGLRDSIDRPMQTYSSGMRARLAFTIATELTPEILIVDEALAVGDRRFRARAAERLEEIRAAAGSIIVVSHNLGEISSTCTRVVWLEAGQIVSQGDSDTVITEYEAANPAPTKPDRELRRRERPVADPDAPAHAAGAERRPRAKLQTSDGAQ